MPAARCAACAAGPPWSWPSGSRPTSFLCKYIMRNSIVHIRELEPLFIDGLLNFLESLQPFAPGLKPSMRMSLLELVQNFAEHSGSATGAWASGHKYRNRITLCLLDLGKGIPASLRSVEQYHRMGDPHLIELATE